MPLIENPTFDDYDSILAYLGNDALRWNAQTDLGTNVIITYSFPQGDALPDGTGYYGVDGFEGFTEAQEASFRTVLDQVEAFSGVRFVEVDEDAMIDGMIGLNGVGVSGYASYPYMNNGISNPSDVVMVYTDFEEAGSFTYYVALHELGHALGLEHTHEGETPDEGDDITANSVMTYNYNPIPSEYGTFDVAALEHLYGDNTESETWAFSTKPNGTLRTVGSRGDDDMMGISGRNEIRAGLGDDVVFGRESADNLQGQWGNDTLYGAQGNDMLRGGDGDDMLIGGEGLDMMHGGAGADIFAFYEDDGKLNDKINDFTQGDDVIALHDTGVSFDDLRFTTSGNGRNLLIRDGDDIRIVIRDGAEMELTADDFNFYEGDALVA